MKILIVCRSFNNMAGGIERMATALMNDMATRGHEIYLLTWDQAGAKSFYEFNKSINWYNLDLGTHKEKAGWSLRLKRMMKMRKLLKDINPDVIMAFQHGTFLATKIYSLGQKFTIIAAEREAPARFDHLKSGKYQALIYQSFRLANKITIQCPSYINDYPKYLRRKIVIIPNPVFSAQKFSSPIGIDCKKKILLCVGRLGYQKNQSVLIKAFAQINQQFPDWNLLIAGEGGDRKDLEIQISNLELQSRISLVGAVKNTSELYCKSHLLCLPARWEGFPNVVAESLSHGLPVVGFAGCAGVSDLISHGVNGLLADGNCDADSLAKSLQALMSDGDLRVNMGQNGIESMKQYSPDKIFDKWNKLFSTFKNH